MSKDWHVHCMSCDEEHSFQDANHRDEFMLTLIKHRTAIAALVPLFTDDEFCMLTLNTHYGNVNPFWFAKHEGHHLVAKSEYGDVIEPDL